MSTPIRLFIILVTSFAVNHCGPMSVSELSETSAQDTAYYRISVDMIWSLATHGSAGYPLRQPGQSIGFEPHITNFSIVTHNSDYEMWRLGGMATNNIEGTAEAARSDYFRQEWVDHRESLGTNAYAGCLRAQQNADLSEFQSRCLFVQGVTAPSTAATTFVIRVDSNFPLISMASMLAPSPDWMVGTASLPLQSNGMWVDEQELDLMAIDAGTEQDGGFFYQNPPEVPQKPVQIVSAAWNRIPVGTMKITRLSASASSEVSLLRNEPLFDGFTEGQIPVPSRLGN